MLANEDIGWFPIEKATLLEKASLELQQDVEDDRETSTLESLEAMLVEPASIVAVFHPRLCWLQVDVFEK